MSDKLTKFSLGDEVVPVHFVETQIVKEGVECDIYLFSNDASKDLAIVRVSRGHKTPLQRVLLGDKTVEGLYSGKGTLTVCSDDNSTTRYSLSGSDSDEIVVKVGQTMQWYADGDTDLVFYEICEPPYADGRFEDLIEVE